MVKVTVPPGAMTSDHHRWGSPGRWRGVAVVAGPVVAVVQPPSATISAGTGSSKVAWAVVKALVLVTTTV